jgi:alpha-ribazole phosphatase
MHLYLVRHTKPNVEAGICYGQTDLTLASSFEQELAQVKSKIAHLPNATIYSSPLQRCKQLAQHFNHLGHVNIDARLMELNFGDWEMQKWDDIPSGMIEEWAQDHVMQAPPNGESFYALQQRCINFLEEVSTNTNCHDIVLFTHAGAIRAILAHLLGLPLHHAFRLHVDYASVSIVQRHPQHHSLIKLNL